MQPPYESYMIYDSQPLQDPTTHHRNATRFTILVAYKAPLLDDESLFIEQVIKVGSHFNFLTI